MQVKCPFLFIEQSIDRKIFCVYMVEGMCTNIEINPGNNDAWCTNKIERLYDLYAEEDIEIDSDGYEI